MNAAALKGFVLPVTALAALEVLAQTRGIQSDSIAAPSAIALAFVEAVGDGSLAGATLDTLISVFVGLGVGAAIGLVVGVILGMWRTVDRLSEVTVEAIRPIPSVALLPLALIALGFGYRLEIAIVGFACFWPLLILSRAAWCVRSRRG